MMNQSLKIIISNSNVNSNHEITIQKRKMKIFLGSDEKCCKMDVDSVDNVDQVEKGSGQLEHCFL